MIFGSLPVFGSVPFLFGPYLRPVSCLLRARTPQKKKQGREKVDHERQATNPKSDQAQTQSDSHQQADQNRSPKTRLRKFTLEIIVKLFRNLKRPRFRLPESGRQRLRIPSRCRPREILSEHAMSDPTRLPPLVTVRAGT